jgi:hypothetical protein
MSGVELDDCSVEYVDGGKRMVLAFGKAEGFSIAYDTWESGMGLHYWKDGSWIASNFDPGIILLEYDSSTTHQDPMYEFAMGIPDEARKLAERFQDNQYTVLRMLRRGPLAWHMARHNPALLGLVLEYSETHCFEDYQVDSLLRMKRDQLLRHMGYVVPKWAPRYLAKLALKKISEGLIHTIGRSLKELEVATYLKRFNFITHYMLAKASHIGEFLDCRLCQGISHNEHQREVTLGQVASLAPDAYRMGKEVIGDSAKPMIMRCSSIRQLKALHDEMMYHWNILRCRKFRNEYGDFFPGPPLPGNDHIIPITTAQDLWDEGQEMHHCVASLADSIMEGELFVYKVLKPQRATLSVDMSSGNPLLTELKLACNEEPGDATWDMVRAWFYNNSLFKNA